MRTGVIVVAVALGVACEAPVQQMPPARPAGVRVVDLIPRSLSGETWQDAEPFLALYASNPKLMAASAFTPNPGGSESATAPIFVSDDGGDSWTLRNTLPSQSMTADITHAVGGTAPVLYAGVMKGPGFPLNELKADDSLPATTRRLQASRSDIDQPFVRTSAVENADRVYVASMISRHRTGAARPSTSRSTGARPMRPVASKPAAPWGRTVRPSVRQWHRIIPCTSPTSAGARRPDRM